MVAATLPTPETLPHAIADGVRASIRKVFGTICGEEPKVHQAHSPATIDTCIAASISFLGDHSWSYRIILAQDSATQIAKQYFGMDVPFDSDDMNDAAGEIANVLAGDVIAQLESRGVKARMSLPKVFRACLSDLRLASNGNCLQTDYLSKQGPFWLQLTANQSDAAVQMPGVQK